MWLAQLINTRYNLNLILHSYDFVCSIGFKRKMYSFRTLSKPETKLPWILVLQNRRLLIASVLNASDQCQPNR